MNVVESRDPQSWDGSLMQMGRGRDRKEGLRKGHEESLRDGTSQIRPCPNSASAKRWSHTRNLAPGPERRRRGGARTQRGAALGNTGQHWAGQE